jgi:hypothetical protein
MRNFLTLIFTFATCAGRGFTWILRLIGIAKNGKTSVFVVGLHAAL